MSKITPVLLSGGTGSRLWPLSREAFPKQLLPLLGNQSLIQATLGRVANSPLFGPPLVVANADHRFLVAEQLREVGCADATIVLEPFGRNTCPAAAVASILAGRQDPDGMILLMPADHRIGNEPAFLAALESGVDAARQGSFVLFGITPTTPATGYGYIHVGDATDGGGVHRVLSFKEKPDLATAEGYLASGEYAWNSGIFLLPTRRFNEELARLEPELLKACVAAIDEAVTDLDFLRLDPEAFGHVPNISIDYAVMEKTHHAVVVRTECDWSDIGTWSTLWEIADKDPDSNAALGDVQLLDTRDCYVRSDGPLVATLGVENLIVVATPDAVLVAARDRDQDIKNLVDTLKAAGHPTAIQTQRVHRPWGYYQSLHIGDRFQVKRLMVAPGQRLSLQKHFHRAEHWVVVNGTARVTRGEDEVLLRENESIDLPVGCVHRLENPGHIPLDLIEVQSGSYLGEDDIVRLDDIYGRKKGDR